MEIVTTMPTRYSLICLNQILVKINRKAQCSSEEEINEEFEADQFMAVFQRLNGANVDIVI